MAHALRFINWLLPLLYLGLLIDYGAAFFLRTRAHQRNRWLLVPIAMHAAFLSLRAVRLGHPPLASGFDILSFVALAMTVAYCVVEFASGDRRTGMFVLLMVFLFQYTSSVFLAPMVGRPIVQAEAFHWERLHTLPAIMAYTGFTLAAVYGVLHLLARRSLKQHRFGVLFERLPSLDLLGHMTWYALVFGFVFITVAVASGPFLFRSEQAGTSIWDPKLGIKIFVGTAAWLIYGVALLGRLVFKRPSAWVSRVAVGGFVLIMVVMVGSILFS